MNIEDETIGDPALDKARVEYIRAGGELKIACPQCKGVGRRCWPCAETGWVENDEYLSSEEADEMYRVRQARMFG